MFASTITQLTRVRLCIVAALLCAQIACLAAPTVKEFAVAINQAGRQRMLSQKMTKEFLLIQSDIDAAANRGELGKTVKLFDTTLSRLLQGDPEVSMPAPPTPEIQAQLETVKTLWGPFRKNIESVLAGQPANAECLASVATDNVKLLAEMDRAVTLYEKASQAEGIKVTGSVVNIAGRQRMLTQRMSKDILLIALGTEAAASRTDLKTARDLFTKSLVGLTDGNAELNLPATSNKTIRQQLAQVAQLWEPFAAQVDQVLAKDTPPPAETLRTVADLNPKLLAECQKVVSSFELETY